MMSNWHYSQYLYDIFPNKSIQTIQSTIQTILRNHSNENENDQLEYVIDFLTSENSCDDENLLGEAAGYSRVISDQELSAYHEQLSMIFPDACPTFMTDLCRKKRKTFISLDLLIDEMTSSDYPKRELDANAMFSQLKELLPNADPSYLRLQAETLVYQPSHYLKKFVEDAIENSNYPTMENYLKNQQVEKKISLYTTDFNIKTFLEKVPNPEGIFLDPNRRKHSLTPNDTTDKETLKTDETYALEFLYNFYCYLRKRDIERVFKMNGKDLVRTCNKLDRIRNAKVCPRKGANSTVTTQNLQLLEEIAFLSHRKLIRKILKVSDENYRAAKEEAELNGLLQTCNCCYNEELIPEECYFCNDGCIFCKDCVKSGAEAVIGNGGLQFPCLAGCGSEFSIATLQMVLTSVVFSRMAQRRQMEEIKNANIDGLESCPFCDFVTIPPPNDKILCCLNEECKKESCRVCRCLSHIPLRCSEIEYDKDVKMRTYIENRMTEALLRKCRKCTKVFIKESGCNKMTCPCGASMCYVCGKSIIGGYTHFDTALGCPLYTKDLNKFHVTAVIQGATAAKAELGIDINPNLLKNDPTKGLEDHYLI